MFFSASKKEGSESRQPSRSVRSARLGALSAGVLVLVALVGCGPAPGYESAPETPVGYSELPPRTESAAEPATKAASATGQAGAATTGLAGAGAPDDVEIGSDADAYADTDPSALTDFRAALDGHGAWVDDPTYGTVWVPAESEVGRDFVPYVTAGRWSYDDADSWVWVSDYSWGWAPFHYGRWTNIRRHGWVWIPGRTYAGAWVVWRTGMSGYDYVGWAPAPPDWYWYNGYALAWTFGYNPYYSYCQPRYIYDYGFGRTIVRGPTYDARTRPYRASAPPAGRVVAAPSVGGRTVANPSVAGRVTASPTVAERSPARPAVGPTPAEMGIARSAVPQVPTVANGVTRAKTFATPRTAVAIGASRPTRFGVRSPDRETVVSAPSFAPPSRLEPVARAPQYTNVVPTAPRPVWHRPYAPVASASASAPPSPSRFGAMGSSSLSAPSGAPQPMASPLVPRASAPVDTFRSSAPRVHAPTPVTVPRAPTAAFRPSPSPRVTVQPSAPVFRAPSPVVRAPSPMSSPRFSGSTFRASPSPSFRPSAPRVASPPRSSSPPRHVFSGSSIRRR